MCGRTQATLDDTAAAIEATGQRALALTADVTKADEVNTLIDQIVSAWGRLDIACNNAGVNNWVEAAEMSEEDWDWIYDTNVKGAFLCSQAEGRAMMAAGSGSIINLASISARITNRPQPQSHYNSSKAALVQLSKSMAAEWAAHGVRVNSLSPGYTRTEMADAPAHPRGPADLETRHAAGPDGRGGGTAGRRGVPGLRRLVLRHRSRPDRGWRLHRLVTPPAFALPAPAGGTRAWGIKGEIKGELSLASPPPMGAGWRETVLTDFLARIREFSGHKVGDAMPGRQRVEGR